MGWKAIKENYRIGHIVQVTDEGICIGSGYIHDLIVISPDGSKVTPVSYGLSGDLVRIYDEITADLDKAKELLSIEDKFENSITVYTYEGSNILEKQCEALGWPNVTHDGRLMYDNTYSIDRGQVIRWALKGSEASVEAFAEFIADQEKRLTEIRGRYEQAVTDRDALAKMVAALPSVSENSN